MTLQPKAKSFQDSMLLASGPLKRYSSLAAAGISLTDLPITDAQKHETAQWRDRISRVLIAKDKIRTETRATEGWRVDVDEAIAGESECFRLKRHTKPAPIKIGINVSSAYGSWHMNALRGGAVLAFTDLCKRQGRKFTIELVYGNGLKASQPTCHTRIALDAYSTTVTHAALSSKTLEEVGEKCVRPLARSIGGDWTGLYRFHEFEARGIHEYDFVLDRIETDDIETERKRIMERLLKLGVVSPSGN